jgi:phosphoribosylanthranilate isomerase
MNRVQIKICGITTVEDAKVCAESGADMIGLNFYRPSPRFIEPVVGRQIVEAIPGSTRAVGVFVDADADEVRRIASVVDLSCVQLHGNVSPEICRDLAQQFHVIRAFQTDDHFQPENVASFSDCDALLDAAHPELRGGTGRTSDWPTARATRPFTRFLILSGGLNAKNVRQAIEMVGPQAVDVCSDVESAPGVKSHDAIQKFIAAVRE